MYVAYQLVKVCIWRKSNFDTFWGEGDLLLLLPLALNARVSFDRGDCQLQELTRYELAARPDQLGPLTFR
jgi:hypothetical protein